MEWHAPAGADLPGAAVLLRLVTDEEVDGEEEGEMDREPEMEAMSPEEEDAMMMSRM